MGEPFFVDCHSHVAPSGDDGAATLDEGLELCEDAARHGTAVLYATPHVWPQLGLSAARERAVRQAHADLRARSSLDLRLGFELTPAPALLDEHPARFALEGTRAVLIEVPFTGPVDLLFELAGYVEGMGFQPVIAHPERAFAVREQPAILDELAGRGWRLQVNASSLLGHHGGPPQELGWNLLERGLGALVASDGHRLGRPARLDEAYRRALERLGPEARALFDGSALGLVRARPTPSRAASPGA